LRYASGGGRRTRAVPGSKVTTLAHWKRRLDHESTTHKRARRALKSVMTRWKALPLKWSCLPERPTPFSPVHKARKFSAVLGTTSARSSISMRPAEWDAVSQRARPRSRSRAKEAECGSVLPQGRRRTWGPADGHVKEHCTRAVSAQHRFSALVSVAKQQQAQAAAAHEQQFLPTGLGIFRQRVLTYGFDRGFEASRGTPSVISNAHPRSSSVSARARLVSSA
jgi:hypothetical protein